jgi:hypothetical protein
MTLPVPANLGIRLGDEKMIATYKPNFVIPSMGNEFDLPPLL